MATRRFSTLGLLSVGTLLATGLVNTWMLAGSLAALLETDYGRLLLPKIALFVAMVAIASINRLRLTRPGGGAAGWRGRHSASSSGASRNSPM